MDKNIFAKNLKAVRDSKSMSQAEFAEHLGIVQSTYSAYESGKSLPNTEILFRICDTCNISADWLIGLSERSKLEVSVNSYADAIGCIQGLNKAFDTVNIGGTGTIASVDYAAGEPEYISYPYALLLIVDENLSLFFQQNGQMRDLLKKGAIDSLLYQEWIRGKVDSFSEAKIEKSADTLLDDIRSNIVNALDEANNNHYRPPYDL